MKKIILLVLGFFVLPWLSLARAESYPDRPIRLVVGYPPGGLVDATARLIAASLQRQMRQPVIVDNKPGASGVVAAKWASQQPADGYTLLYAATSTHSIMPYLGGSIGYDPIKDFSPVSAIHRGGLVLVANVDSPFKDLRDVISIARKNPSEVMYASPGEGTAQQMAMTLFAKINKIKLTEIAYKGSGPATVNLLGGVVPLMIDNVLPALPLIKGNRLRALAVTGSERIAVLPEVPTMIESGVAGMDVQAWNGIVAPAGLPENIVDSLNRAVSRALAEPQVRKAIIDGGSKPMEGSAKDFEDFMLSQASQWKAFIATTKSGTN